MTPEVDRALRESVELVLVTHGRRSGKEHAVPLRFAYAGFAPERIDVLPNLRAGLERGLALSDPAEELVVLPTYTAMLALRKLIGGLGAVRPYWEQAA